MSDKDDIARILAQRYDRPVEELIGKELETLLAEVRQMQQDGRIPSVPTREQRISWAYDQTRLAGSDITREQVAEIHDNLYKGRGDETCP